VSTGGSVPQQLNLSLRGRELALAHFNHVEQQVTLAATTAGLIVAADALIIGAYVTVVKEYKVFKELGTSLEVVGFAAGGGMLILGFVLALLAAFPNVSFKWFRMAVDSVFFFGKIGSQSFDAYLRDFQERDQAQELDQELLSQIWAKSRWLLKIFRFIQGAIACTLAGTLLIVVILLVVAPRLHG
jgi:hypothetical protein